MSSTIVTALDPNYLWGAYLLVSSLRYHGVTTPVHILAYQFSLRDKALLTQFDDVEIFELDHLKWRYFNCLKPAAIQTAKTDYITWMDADCIVTGNVEPYLTAKNQSLQMRFRSTQEHLELYQNLFPELYTTGEKEPFPSAILDQWMHDLNERGTHRFETTCSACCFTLHRQHLGFVSRWEEQMAKVLPSVSDDKVQRPVVNWENSAYRLTDEAVLNSLLAFAEDVPEITEYQLDKDESAKLVHFATSPKPWELWLPRYQSYYTLVMNLIKWAEAKGLETPKRPFALTPGLKSLNFTLGKGYQALSTLKHRYF